MPGLAGVKILLVEDNDDSREVTRLALEARGALLVCAANAREAVAAFDTAAPDVLVSDIGMPGEDGHSLLKQLKAHNKRSGLNIPAIALTAYDSREHRMESRDSGFHYHLAKPADPDKLAEIILGLVRLTRR